VASSSLVSEERLVEVRQFDCTDCARRESVCDDANEARLAARGSSTNSNNKGLISYFELLIISGIASNPSKERAIVAKLIFEVASLPSLLHLLLYLL
jgi:hypothetical protein